MGKNVQFGDTLVRLRRAQGYAGAHAFFKSAGGAKVLGISFPNYLALEKGRSLPKAHRIATLLQALGIGAGAPERAELIRAYLSSLIGDSELLDHVAGPAKSPASSLEGEAVRLALRQRAVNMDMEQWKAVAADTATYFVDAYLQNTPGLVELSAIAKATGIPEPKVAAILKRLAAVKLAELVGRKARGLLAQKLIQPLPLLPATAGLKSAINKRHDELSRRARQVKRYHIQVRIPNRNPARYAEQLQNAIDVSAAYGDVEKASDTALYTIDARIIKLTS